MICNGEAPLSVLFAYLFGRSHVGYTVRVGDDACLGMSVVNVNVGNQIWRVVVLLNASLCDILFIVVLLPCDIS